MFETSLFANLARKWGFATVTILIVAYLLLPATIVTGQGVNPATPDGNVTITLEEAPKKPDKFDRVYDLPRRLNADQYERFHYDIGRLWDDGLPAMIYIRSDAATEAESQFFADSLRKKWEIESAPGADDGLVLLVTIRKSFPKTATLSVSYGENALPTGQMTVDVLNEVLKEEADPRINVGNVNGGLTYALRRILYYTEYTAPFPAERTSAEDFAHGIAPPLNVFLAILVIALIAIPASRYPIHLRRYQKWGTLATACVVSCLALAVAVFGRQTFATGIALVCVLLTLVLLGKLVHKPVRQRVVKSSPARFRAPQRRRVAESHRRA